MKMNAKLTVVQGVIAVGGGGGGGLMGGVRDELDPIAGGILSHTNMTIKLSEAMHVYGMM